MRTFGTVIFMCAALFAAGYAHYRIPAHTSPGKVRWFTHLLLICVGLAFGWAVTTVYYPTEGPMKILVFLYSFGVVHVPAAFILFIKQRRRRA